MDKKAETKGRTKAARDSLKRPRSAVSQTKHPLRAAPQEKAEPTKSHQPTFGKEGTKVQTRSRGLSLNKKEEKEERSLLFGGGGPGGREVRETAWGGGATLSK